MRIDHSSQLRTLMGSELRSPRWDVARGLSCDWDRTPGPQTPNTSGLHLLWQPEGNCTEQTPPVSATKFLGDLSSSQQLLTPSLSSRHEGHGFLRAHSAKSSPSQEKKEFHCWQVHKRCSSPCPHPLCQVSRGGWAWAVIF